MGLPSVYQPTGSECEYWRSIYFNEEKWNLKSPLKKLIIRGWGVGGGGVIFKSKHMVKINIFN